MIGIRAFCLTAVRRDSSDVDLASIRFWRGRSEIQAADDKGTQAELLAKLKRQGVLPDPR